jgi:predicted Zn-dependent protease with MMP-like domain
MDPTLVPREAFEAMVVDALDTLPDWIIPIVAEIAVLVEDEQPAAEVTAGVLRLGVFHGVPRTRAGGRVPGTLPDTITLYRIPILRVCRDVADVPDRVMKVVGHEVGHAMGLSESRLRELGWH